MAEFNARVRFLLPSLIMLKEELLDMLMLSCIIEAVVGQGRKCMSATVVDSILPRGNVCIYEYFHFFALV